MHIKKTILLLLLLISNNCLFAQSKDDTQLWLGVSVKKKIYNTLSGSFQYRVRKVDNISSYKGSYFYFALEKKLNKTFSIETNYRLAVVDNLYYNRYALGVEVQLKSDHNKFIFRPMVQYQKQATFNDIETSYNSRSYFRPRVSWKNDYLKNLEWYIHLEPFYKIDNNINVNWWQNTLGLKYEVNKKVKLNPYFIWQPDFTKKSPATNYIIGFDLEFNFK
jgi:hypothetical protein